LLPLLASLASLLFFYLAGKRLLLLTALPFACAAFAPLDPAIYYAATIKQCEPDVAAARGLYALAATLLLRVRLGGGPPLTSVSRTESSSGFYDWFAL
jgi:hypothetical protein